MFEPKKEFMKAAIQEALKSKESGDYAIGAVVVKDDKIIATGGQRVKLDKDPFYHAEIVAIRNACRLLDSRHIEDCILYTTHEPCPMCAAAAVWAKMKGIVSGATQNDIAEHRVKSSNNEWLWRTIDLPPSRILEKGDPKVFHIREFMREECKKLFHS